MLCRCGGAVNYAVSDQKKKSYIIINAIIIKVSPLLVVRPVPGQVEFVLSGCISFFPVTHTHTSAPLSAGLILMLNRFSFANDVARLQSGPAEYAWTAADFYGDAGPSAAPLAAVIHSITGDPADGGPAERA